jgi:perosamine synthetase
MQVPLSRPDITEEEIEAVCEVLRSPQLSLGPKGPAFEQEFRRYVGTRRAVAVNSGTSGLFLCLRALGIGPGDEVITTPFTFIASTTCIVMAGATPVFADIDPRELNLDPEAVEARITPRTRAILPVEVFGNPAGMDRISRLADREGLPVVEDSCEALGSSLYGRMAGTFGRMAVFGFYPNKQITTGEGGMIVTDDDRLADLCVSLRNQGRALSSRWLCHERLGYNFRLSDIHAALGLVQLSRIEEIKARRRQVAEWYRQRLADEDRLILPAPPANGDISWFVYVVRLCQEATAVQRDRVLETLRQEGIQAGNYFPPVHLQPFIARDYGYKKGDFPIAESVAERTLALPFYNALTQDEVAFVCERLRQALDLVRPALLTSSCAS